MFGRPRGDFIGLPFTQLVHSGQEPSEQLAWSTPVTGVHAIAAQRHDGTEVAIDVSFSAMTVGGERLVIAVMRESTAQLQRYARDLERRNQELDQFADVAAHDLKAPLRAIANLATWIEDDLKGMIGAIGRQHLDLLRGRVCAGSRRSSRASTSTPPPPARPRARRASTPRPWVREIADEHDQQRRFAIAIAPGLPVLTTDRTRLWQVFSNLIANAIKHHHLGFGTIEVGGREVGDRWEFSVADDGPGIAPEYHEKVFVIFQTLVPKDVRESLGLGLALVKKIVREQGGNVSLEAEVGSGATFRFTWPKQRPAGGVQRVSPPPFHLLLVEDDEVDALTFRRALAQQHGGVPLHVARHAEQALDLLRRGCSASEASAALGGAKLDLNLPGTGGIELLRHLRADPALAAIPVVVMTTSVD